MTTRIETELAAQWLMAWFLTRYADPEASCPYASAEGGYQYIWGGPHNAGDVLRHVWGGIFEAVFLAQVATRLEEEQDCTAWSDVPDAEDGIIPCAVCDAMTHLACMRCGLVLCRDHLEEAHGTDGHCELHPVPVPPGLL
jgi:hypothetical protein